MRPRAHHAQRALSAAALCSVVAFITSCGSGGGSTSSTTPTSTAPQAAVHYSASDSARLADQATFGSMPAQAAEIEEQGPAWIDAQIATPATGYPVLPALDPTVNYCPSPANPGQSPTCYRDTYTPFPVQRAFFQNALTGKDQLRQRVAFAYSQIFVVSANTIGPAYAMREYQQMLLNDAFVNFRQILNDVTLSPVMGAYLNMANNNKGNASGTIVPNENYAREVLQLFSIGPNMLKSDGTIVTDSYGQPVPTYNATTILGFASVFTGWTYPTYPGATPPQYGNNYNQYFMGQMIPFQNNHDTGAKVLLRGTTLPAGQSITTDLKDGLDNIFNHPNVGPFIGKQLIQLLVTSNPSPAYVGRVAAVFNDNGDKVRGDMGAVVKAILTDPEARGDAPADATFGKLKEPAIMITSVLRALQASSDGEFQINESQSMGMNMFTPGSVFNFYHPADFLPGSQTLVGPQFTLATTSNTVAGLNFLNSLIYANNGFIPPDNSVSGATGTQIDLSSYAAAADDPTTMVKLMNTNFLHGVMPSPELDPIIVAVEAIPTTQQNYLTARAQAGAFLMFASPRFQISR